VKIYHAAKFHPDGIRGFVSAHARFRASNCLLGYFFVPQVIYSQDARTDFDEKCVKRRGFAQGCAFWGSQNQKLSFTHFFCPKTTILGPYPHQRRCNSAMDSRVNFKLRGNDERGWLNTWHAL